MKKVVSDRRASLDEETEIKPALRKLVEDEFRRGASIPIVPFPRDGAEIPDTPRLTLVVADPEAEWSGGSSLRNWPPALRESEAWPLASLRQSFLNGSLTRLVDPDAILRNRVVEFVGRGDFGLASGRKPDGSYERVWLQELVTPGEVAFEADLFLLKKVVAEALEAGAPNESVPLPSAEPVPGPVSPPRPGPAPGPEPEPGVQTRTLRLMGTVPPEVWNRLGTKILPKLRSGSDLKIGLDFSVTVKADGASSLASELRQVLQDLSLAEQVQIE